LHIIACRLNGLFIQTEFTNMIMGIYKQSGY
jgi:hypothetical protein